MKVFEIKEKSAITEVGLPSGSSCFIGTKYTLRVFISIPIFFEFAERASFVATAIIRGLEFLKCAFAAIVTDVSVTPNASFASVFPVQGSIIRNN